VQIFSCSGTIINIIAKNTVLAIIKQRSIDINTENLYLDLRIIDIEYPLPSTIFKDLPIALSVNSKLH